MKPFAIGDKVAYSVQFLRSTGMSHTDAAHARGVITALEKFGGAELATIKWDRDMPERVITPNLAHVGANRKFANVD